MNMPSTINLDQGDAAMSSRMAALIDAGLSLQRIAVEASVKRFELQAWMDGRCTDENVQARVVNWFRQRDTISQEEELAWVKTPTSQKIGGALAYAQRTPTIALIYGGAGVSKTTTATRYKNDENEKRRSRFGSGARSTIFYVSASTYIRTPVAVLHKISEAVGGCGEHAYRNDTLAKAILRAISPGDLLIVDEAQHLEPAALDGIRYFHDEGGIGIAYLGNEEVYNRINGRTRKATFAQLSSRVGMRLNIELPAEEDVDAILEAWGIGGRNMRTLAHNVALKPGGLRGLAQVLLQSRNIATDMNRPVDPRIMKAAARSLGHHI